MFPRDRRPQPPRSPFTTVISRFFDYHNSFSLVLDSESYLLRFVRFKIHYHNKAVLDSYLYHNALAQQAYSFSQRIAVGGL